MMQLSAWNSTVSKFLITNSSGTSSKIDFKLFYFLQMREFQVHLLLSKILGKSQLKM